MKHLLLLSLAFAITSCGSYSTLTFDESENYMKVYEDFVGTKDELYLKSNDWMIKTFVNAESVIQHNDKAEGVIIGKYLMFGAFLNGAYGATADSRVYAVIDIRVKDNKARIEIKPQSTWKYGEMTIYDFSKNDAQLEMVKLADSFHKSLAKENVKF